MKPSPLRWTIVGLIALATIVNYIDRNALAVMWPEISRQIGASKDDYALLITVFMLAYALGQLLFGKLFDVLGVRRGFTLSISAWSLSIGLHALTASIGTFAIVRGMLGLSEAGAWPGAVKANAQWFPPQERAFAQGMFNAGASLGAIVSAPLIALLFLEFGWRGTFALVAVLGFAWLVPWLILYRADADRRADSTQDAHRLDDDATLQALTLKQLMRHRQSWGIVLARFFLDPIWWLFVSWLPIYLAETFGFDIKQIGLFAWVPYVGAMLGSLFGGWCSGRLIVSGRDVHCARKWTITLGAALMLPGLIAAMHAATPTFAVLAICVVLFGFQVAIGNVQTLPGDVFRGSSVGSLAGIGGMAAVVGTLITTWLVPSLTVHSYAPAFALAAALIPLALIAVWWVAGSIEPIDGATVRTNSPATF